MPTTCSAGPAWTTTPSSTRSGSAASSSRPSRSWVGTGRNRTLSWVSSFQCFGAGGGSDRLGSNMGRERRTPYGLVIGFVVGILTAGLMVPFVRAEETTTTQRAGEAGPAKLDRQPGTAPHDRKTDRRGKRRPGRGDP